MNWTEIYWYQSRYSNHYLLILINLSRAIPFGFHNYFCNFQSFKHLVGLFSPCLGLRHRTQQKLLNAYSGIRVAQHVKRLRYCGNYDYQETHLTMSMLISRCNWQHITPSFSVQRVSSQRILASCTQRLCHDHRNCEPVPTLEWQSLFRPRCEVLDDVCCWTNSAHVAVTGTAMRNFTCISDVYKAFFPTELLRKFVELL